MIVKRVRRRRAFRCKVPNFGISRKEVLIYIIQRLKFLGARKIRQVDYMTCMQMNEDLVYIDPQCIQKFDIGFMFAASNQSKLKLKAWKSQKERVKPALKQPGPTFPLPHAGNKEQVGDFNNMEQIILARNSDMRKTYFTYRTSSSFEHRKLNVYKHKTLESTNWHEFKIKKGNEKDPPKVGSVVLELQQMPLLQRAILEPVCLSRRILIDDLNDLIFPKTKIYDFLWMHQMWKINKTLEEFKRCSFGRRRRLAIESGCQTPLIRISNYSPSTFIYLFGLILFLLTFVYSI